MTGDATNHRDLAQTGGLTVREAEVLELVGADLREDEIGNRLGIAHSTVAIVLRSAMAKLGAETRQEARRRWASMLAAHDKQDDNRKEQ